MAPTTILPGLLVRSRSSKVWVIEVPVLPAFWASVAVVALKTNKAMAKAFFQGFDMAGV